MDTPKNKSVSVQCLLMTIDKHCTQPERDGSKKHVEAARRTKIIDQRACIWLLKVELQKKVLLVCSSIGGQKNLLRCSAKEINPICHFAFIVSSS